MYRCPYCKETFILRFMLHKHENTCPNRPRGYYSVDRQEEIHREDDDDNITDQVFFTTTHSLVSDDPPAATEEDKFSGAEASAEIGSSDCGSNDSGGCDSSSSGD